MTQALQDKTQALIDIKRYVNSGPFQTVLEDFYNLEVDDRNLFVSHVITNPEAMRERGAEPPEDIFISTSEFNDGRPTAFAVCKYLPDGERRMTVTFDHVRTGKRQD
jgi:hypothetical protein